MSFRNDRFVAISQFIQSDEMQNEGKLELSPLTLVPAPLGDGWQARHTEVIGLQVLSRSPGNDPNQLLVVRFVTFARAVLSHTFGHQLLPVEQLAVADL